MLRRIPWVPLLFGVFAAWALLSAILTGRGITMRGIGPGILVLIAFGGLGILGGLWYGRFTRFEAERQKAALAEQQLEIARDLQQRLLPVSPLQQERYRVDARNIPAAYVAGDFYDLIPLPNDRLLIVVADVAGKGVWKAVAPTRSS